MYFDDVDDVQSVYCLFHVHDWRCKINYNYITKTRLFKYIENFTTQNSKLGFKGVKMRSYNVEITSIQCWSSSTLNQRWNGMLICLQLTMYNSISSYLFPPESGYVLGPSNTAIPP